VLRADDLVLLLPTSVACSAWVLAQLGEADEALSRLRESERLLEREVSTGSSHITAGRSTHWDARVCCWTGSTRRKSVPAARSSLPRVSRASLPHALHLLGDIAIHPDRFDPQIGEVS
jgi:hypothetical protein